MISHQTSSEKKLEHYVIGLTGNICSGKSKAAEYFEQLGAYVIDTDKVVHGIYKKNWALKYKIYQRFGLKAFNYKLEVDRKKLSRIVFSEQKENIKDLEKIVWAYVGKEVDKRTKKKKGIVIIEAPMLYESGISKKMFCNITVTVSEDEQLRRLMKRNSMGREEAVKRISAQMPQFEKVKLSDYVIENNDSLDILKRNVQQAWMFLYAKIAQHP
ncbi:dephospho-CoA kinase [Candidatus Woesearchaeota archaeon]|nr:dephospho-CoA kinase [Candidatus Woesearchaeota archaeon]